MQSLSEDGQVLLLHTNIGLSGEIPPMILSWTLYLRQSYLVSLHGRNSLI